MNFQNKQTQIPSRRKRTCKRRRGASYGNRKAVGNSGGGAPIGNRNAAGHGAPRRNINAVKHGFFAYGNIISDIIEALLDDIES